MSNIIDYIEDEAQNIEISEAEIPEFIIADDVAHTLTAHFADGRVEQSVVAKEYDHLWEEIKASLAPLIVKSNDLN